jgi:haloacetate dehalogenase
MGPESYDYVRAAVHDRATVRAMLEDYRAGLSVDVEHDRATREADEKIGCPTLVAWSLRDDLEELYGDPVAIWRPWVAAPITSARIDSGHHMAEENPQQLTEVLAAFARATAPLQR